MIDAAWLTAPCGSCGAASGEFCGGDCKPGEEVHGSRVMASEALAAALAASPRTPTPEVLRAAERIGELAKECSEGPWFAHRHDGPRIVDTWWSIAVGALRMPRQIARVMAPTPQGAGDAAFIAECRTLAPLVAEWVKGGGR